MPKPSGLLLSTDREVQSAKPCGARAEYRVKDAKNLVLRVTPAKSKTWFFLYASPLSGKRRKLALGTYPSLGLAEAKRRALTLTLAVQTGVDPLLERQAEKSAETFAKLAARYMAEHERKNARAGKRSAWTKEAQRLLDADILPRIGGHKAEALTKREVMDVVEAIADRGAYVTADRVLGLTRAIYNWANATGRLEVNPTLGLKKRNAGRARERVLSDAEIRALWAILDTPSKLSPAIRDALRLQLLLGLRISEVLGASKREVDVERQVWTIPAIRTKSEREHRIPLSPCATSILRTALERSGDSPLLFPSRMQKRRPHLERGDKAAASKRLPNDPDAQPIRAKSAMRAVLRLRRLAQLPGFGTHDLRRTMATRLGDMGVAEEVIGRILNHAPRTVTGRHYNHAKHFDAIRHALDAWGKRLELIVNPECPVAGLCASE